MKKLLFIFLWILVFMSGLESKEIGNFDITTTDTNEIKVKNSLMTYYYLRFHSSDGTRVSEPILINPASNKLTSNLKVTLNTFTPQIQGEWLAIASKETKEPITFKGWENSNISLQGANLFDNKASPNFSISSKLTLSALNLLQISQMGLDAVTSGQVSGAITTVNALKLPKYFTKAKDYAENISLLLSIEETAIETLEILEQDATPAEKEDLLEFKRQFTIIKEIIDKSSKVLGSIKANNEAKQAYKKIWSIGIKKRKIQISK